MDKSSITAFQDRVNSGWFIGVANVGILATNMVFVPHFAYTTIKNYLYKQKFERRPTRKPSRLKLTQVSPYNKINPDLPSSLPLEDLPTDNIKFTNDITSVETDHLNRLLQTKDEPVLEEPKPEKKTLVKKATMITKAKNLFDDITIDDIK